VKPKPVRTKRSTADDYQANLQKLEGLLDDTDVKVAKPGKPAERAKPASAPSKSTPSTGSDLVKTESPF
jgi:hypothetical protein